MESFAARWGRRAVSIPVLLVFGGAYLALLPVTLAVTLALDAVRPAAARAARARAAVFFALYVVCELAGTFAALALGALTLGGALGGRARYLGANAALQRAWTDALFFGSVRVFGLRVVTEGLEAAREGPLLFFVRHTSTADAVLTAALVANPGRMLLLYVLKRELLWDPCLDLVGTRLPNTFVARGRGRSRQGAGARGAGSDAEVAAVAALARGLGPTRGVLIYPEGTRYSPAKHARAIAELRARGHEALAARAERFRHVLPPKLGGPLALLDAAPEADVVFVAHTGFEGAATFREFWRGALVGKTVRLRLTRAPAASIPRDDRAAWLYDRWAELDAWVDAVTSVPPSSRAG
jgi:1-acyl-sn-glycerol-3-phosphate acyltransferase